MRTLDRYVIRSFLYTALLFFLIFMSLRIVLDLGFNINDFLSGKASAAERFWAMASYYYYQVPVYVIELGGVMIVASAAFTLARMNHSNELTAILASGVSLRRVVLPVFLFAILLDAAIIADRELLIPNIAPRLVRGRDSDLPGKHEGVPARTMPDKSGAVWFSPLVRNGLMDHPGVSIRSAELGPVGRIAAAMPAPTMFASATSCSKAGSSRTATSNARTSIGCTCPTRTRSGPSPGRS